MCPSTSGMGKSYVFAVLRPAKRESARLAHSVHAEAALTNTSIVRFEEDVNATVRESHRDHSLKLRCVSASH